MIDTKEITLDRFLIPNPTPKKGFRILTENMVLSNTCSQARRCFPKQTSQNQRPNIETVAYLFLKEPNQEDRADLAEVLLECYPEIKMWQLITQIAQFARLWRPRVENYFRTAAKRVGRVWG